MEDKGQDGLIVSVDELLEKKFKVVSSEEALHDVVPPEWSDEVLNGEVKVVARAKDEAL